MLAWRRRSDVLATLFFFVIVVSLFPLSIAPELPLLRTIARRRRVAAYWAMLYGEKVCYDYRTNARAPSVNAAPTSIVAPELSHWLVRVRYNMPVLAPVRFVGDTVVLRVALLEHQFLAYRKLRVAHFVCECKLLVALLICPFTFRLISTGSSKPCNPRRTTYFFTRGDVFLALFAPGHPAGRYRYLRMRLTPQRHSDRRKQQRIVAGCEFMSHTECFCLPYFGVSVPLGLKRYELLQYAPCELLPTVGNDAVFAAVSALLFIACVCPVSSWRPLISQARLIAYFFTCRRLDGMFLYVDGV